MLKYVLKHVESSYIIQIMLDKVALMNVKQSIWKVKLILQIK